jgi:hypothetical protein
MYKINNSLKLNTCEKNVNHKHPNNKNMNMNMNMNMNNDSNMIHEDIAKLHLLPEYCPMTPKTYTDFFNHNTQNQTHNTQKHLPGVSPYKLEKVKHPREGYKYTMEYNNFYTDWNKDALHYTSSNNEFLDSDNNDNHNHNHNHNEPTILTNVNSENILLYKETKPKHEFARPMKMNGSNKVQDLFDNCMNKKTFEYTRYSQISPHHKQWIDNPIFTEDISEETQDLKNNYMNDMEKDNMAIYSSVFEDMYYLSNETDINYNPSEYKYYNYLNKLEQQIDNQYKNNNVIVNDTIQKMKQANIQKLGDNLEDRNMLRSKNIKPNKKYFNNNNYNYNNNNYYNYNNYDNYDNDNNDIKPENINNLGNKLNNQLKNSRNLLSKDVKQKSN